MMSRKCAKRAADRRMVNMTELNQDESERLCYDAIKLYYTTGQGGNHTHWHNDILDNSKFLPILMIGKDPLIHIPSIVAFCHLRDPDKYYNLTQSMMHRLFTDYQIISGKNTSRSYRKI